MAKTSTRVVYPERGRIEVEDFQIESPQGKQLLVETEVSLISAGTELMFLEEQERYPFYPGYSNVGTVIEKGPDAEGYEIGDRVVSQGRHAQHVIVPASPSTVLKVPESVTSKQATFTVQAAVSLHGLRHAYMELGERVLVLGQGIIGQLASQFASLAGGLPIVVLDFYDSRLEKSLENWADIAINPSGKDIEDEVKKYLPEGPEVIFDCTGHPSGMPTAIKLAGEGCKIVIVSSNNHPFTIEEPMMIQRKELKITSVLQPKSPNFATYYYPWDKGRNRSYILDLLARKSLKVDNLIGLEKPGTQAPEAFNMLKQSPGEYLGAILKWF